MAGLVDAFNDPQFQRGLMMMAAARPMSEQQRAGLLAYVDNQEEAKLKKGLLEAQIADKKLEREAALSAQQRQQDAISALNRAITGDQSFAPSIGTEGQPASQLARSPQQGGVANLTAEQVLAAEMSGIKGVREIWNDARTGLERKPNTYYEVNGTLRHYGDPEKGITVGADGNVQAMPGFANTQATLAANKILAEQKALLPFDLARYGGQNRAAAEWRPETVIDPQTGAKVIQSSAQTLYGNRAPMGVPGYATEPQMRASAAQPMGNTQGDYAREISAVQRDLKNPNLSAQDRKLLEDHLATIQAQSQRATKGGPSNMVEFSPEQKTQQEAERVLQVKRAENAAETEKNAPKDAKRQQASIEQANRMILKTDQALAKVGSFSAGPGANLAVIPGTGARNLQADLQTIKANLGFAELQAMREASPTGGALGAVAQQELEALQSTVSSLDQAQSPEQLRRNLNEIKRRYSNWKNTVQQSVADPNAARPSVGKSFSDFGYSNPQAMINDARNALMRNPGARAEIERRLRNAGLSLSGGQ